MAFSWSGIGAKRPDFFLFWNCIGQTIQYVIKRRSNKCITQCSIVFILCWLRAALCEILLHLCLRDCITLPPIAQVAHTGKNRNGLRHSRTVHQVVRSLWFDFYDVTSASVSKELYFRELVWQKHFWGKMEWKHRISVKFIQMTFKWKEKQRGEIVKVSSPHTLNKEKGKTTLLYVVLFFFFGVERSCWATTQQER